MTTVVCSREAMVADTALITERGVITRGGKILRIGRYLVGGAGDCADLQKFFQWVSRGLKGRLPRPTRPNDFEALLVRRDGVILHAERFEAPEEIQENYFAIGIGGQVALGALDTMKRLKRAPELLLAIDVAAQRAEATLPPYEVLTFTSHLRGEKAVYLRPPNGKKPRSR